MPKGLSIPLTVNKGGGAKVEREEFQLSKLVILALLEGGDENPFQDIGLPPKIIYRINDEAAKYDAKFSIEQALKSFEGRLKLGKDGVQISETVNPQTKEAELFVSFEWVDLDTDEEKEFSAKFTDLGV